MADFPVTTILVAPNWIDEPQLSEAAIATSKMLNGAISTLRYSDTQAGGSITCHWDEVGETFLAEFLAFWKTVDLADSFSLPAAFWRAEWAASRVTNYKSLSSTGYWRFKEKPKIIDLNLSSYQIVAVLTASLA